jgi:GNAT superfamily N-acetyltransferase
MEIRQATRTDFDAILGALPAFWGERTPPLHHPLLIEEFDDGALVAGPGDGGPPAAYLFGLFVPAKARAYVHIVAVRASARRQRLGHRLYDVFTERALSRGCTELKAITAPVNAASIAFHTARGMHGRLVPGYSGPGQDRIVFTQSLHPAQ